MRFQGGIHIVPLLAHLKPFLLNAETVSAREIARSNIFFSLEDPDRSGAESIVVIGSAVRLETRQRVLASLVLAEEGVEELPASIPVIRISNARTVVAALIHALSSKIEREVPFAGGGENFIHPSAIVEGTLEGRIFVGAMACVGAGTFIGEGTRIEPGAVILENCRIGRDCVIQSGAVVGSAGFGFLDAGNEQKPMPHLAGVEIGDNCFIGANTVIAAGVLHPTEIGEGCKIDSHVQIAHNVRLGRGCLLASQSGIAGSTVIGEGLRMGGAASIAGHLRLGRNVSVAAKSGVTKDFPDGAVVAGFPARPIQEWRRQQIFLRNQT